MVDKIGEETSKERQSARGAPRIATHGPLSKQVKINSTEFAQWYKYDIDAFNRFELIKMNCSPVAPHV